MTSYLRPLAVVYGPDAVAMIKSGQAASLTGRNDLAFTQAQWIERHGTSVSSRIVSIEEATRHPLFAAITAPRPNFGPLSLGTTIIMGIVNVTPDSFSEGGLYKDSQSAIKVALQMSIDGAAVLDIGGESTRPGAAEISIDEEHDRIMPIVEALAKTQLVSVDTRKGSIMREALQKGATIINDVSALQFDPDSAAVVANAGSPVILMHAQGIPATMQHAPVYDDVVLDVYDQLQAHIAKAQEAGIKRSQIMVDPGIGFGKSFAQNLQLLHNLALFHGLGVGLLVGLSRKGFIGAITGEKTASHRLGGSVAGALHAASQGIQILRVHDVKQTVTALQVFRAVSDPDSVSI